MHTNAEGKREGDSEWERERERAPQTRFFVVALVTRIPCEDTTDHQTVGNLTRDIVSRFNCSYMRKHSYLRRIIQKRRNEAFLFLSPLILGQRTRSKLSKRVFSKTDQQWTNAGPELYCTNRFDKFQLMSPFRKPLENRGPNAILRCV